jgi:DNA processing protein
MSEIPVNNLRGEQLLFIARCRGVGANAFRFLLWKFSENFDFILEFLRSNDRTILPDEMLVKKEWNAIRAAGGGIIFPNDDDFPTKLHSSCLQYIGDRRLLSQPNRLAVIGSRQVSAKGDLLTRNLMKIWKNKYIIVSGLAPGVDSIAHSCAIRTIAVIGYGLGYSSGRVNQELRQKIEKNGLVISEQSFYAGPSRYTFPSRNKIIADISQAVVIMEAQANSGTLNTATYAKAMNKRIFAVPGHPTDLQHVGCNELIKKKDAEILLSHRLQLQKQITFQEKPSMTFQEPSDAEKSEINHLINRGDKSTMVKSRFSSGKIAFVMALRELGFLK